MVKYICFQKFLHYNSYIGNYVRLFVVFVGSPKDETQRPKTLPDFESAVSKIHH